MVSCLTRVDDWFWATLDTRRLYAARWGGSGRCTARMGAASLLTLRFMAFGFIGAMAIYDWVTCVHNAYARVQLQLRARLRC